MNAMLTIFSILLCITGCYAMNHQGTFTTSSLKRLIACTSHFIGIVLCGLAYGAVRGFFVYLGIISLVGIVYSLVFFPLTSNLEKDSKSK